MNDEDADCDTSFESEIDTFAQDYLDAIERTRRAGTLSRYVQLCFNRIDPFFGLLLLLSTDRSQRAEYANDVMHVITHGSDRNQMWACDILRGTSIGAVEAATQNALRAVDGSDSVVLARLSTVITECALEESRSLFLDVTNDTKDEEIVELRRRFNSTIWCGERWGRIIQDWPI